MDDIRTDAINNSSNILDVDNFRSNYIKKDDNITINFVYPILEVWDQYRYLLLENSTRKLMDNKYRRRPDYLSFNEYHTTMLWSLLLYINDVDCIENFTISEVIIPDYSVILEMCTNKKILNKNYNLDKNIVEKKKTMYFPYLKKKG